MDTQQALDLGRARELADQDLVAAFESARQPNERFGHPDHVRLAWIYLNRLSLLDTIARLREGLRRFAAAQGHPERYHETVTWALVVIIHQRMRRAGAGGSWQEFAASNPDLLRWSDGPFFDHYDRAVLESDEAREIFVLPDPPRTAGGSTRGSS